jgi:hypothetical protein
LKTTILNVCELVELPCMADGSLKCYKRLGKAQSFYMKLNIFTFWPGDSTPTYLPKRYENICAHTDLSRMFMSVLFIAIKSGYCFDVHEQVNV